MHAHEINTKPIKDLSFFYSFFYSLKRYYIEAVNWNNYVKKLPKYCDHSLRIISILETSTWRLIKRTKRKVKKRAISFALSNDHELGNIVSKQVTAYQRSRVLITLSRITV